MAPRGYAHNWRGPDFEPNLDDLDSLHDDAASQAPFESKQKMARELATLRTQLATTQQKHTTHLSSCAKTQRHHAATLQRTTTALHTAQLVTQTLHTAHASLETSYDRTREDVIALEARVARLTLEKEMVRGENEGLGTRVRVQSDTVVALRKTIAALESKVEVLERSRRGETALRRLRRVLVGVTQKKGEGEEAREELRGLLAEIMRDEMR